MYDYRCSLCGAVTDHHSRIADRFDRQDCSECGRPACCELDMSVSAPTIGTERRQGRSKIIYSEKQVAQESPLGANWRNEGTTGKEGGAGKKIYGHG